MSTSHSAGVEETLPVAAMAENATAGVVGGVKPAATRARAGSKKRAALVDISNNQKKEKKEPTAKPAPPVIEEDSPVAPAPMLPEVVKVGAVIAAGAGAPAAARSGVNDIDVQEPGARAYIDYVADHFSYLRSMEVRARARLACMWYISG